MSVTDTPTITSGLVQQLAGYHQSVHGMGIQRPVVISTIEWLLRLLFPQHGDGDPLSGEDVARELDHLASQIAFVMEPLIPSPGAVTREFFHQLPSIHQQLLDDATALYDGDPAAASVDEVISTYPGFLAMACYRIANWFHGQGVPLLPRMVTEYAHEKTGIDIHPGATIGSSLCIDHGTGIVIGETSVIGNHVKLYQGVTLGALSVDKSQSHTKRHPTLEDRVVVYAGATILGGSTTIGHDSVIGGNVWLTESVAPFSVVYHKSEVRIRNSREIAPILDFQI